MKKKIVFNAENWEKGLFKISEIHDGFISPVELKKIKQKQTEMFDSWVLQEVNFVIKEFEKGLAGSIDKNGLTIHEIENIRKGLNKNEEVSNALILASSKIITVSNLSEIKNLYFKYITRKIESPCLSIETPIYKYKSVFKRTLEPLEKVVLVFVIFRYLVYLEKLKSKKRHTDNSEKKVKRKEGEPSFEELFNNRKNMETIIKWLKKNHFISFTLNEEAKWLKSKKELVSFAMFLMGNKIIDERKHKRNNQLLRRVFCEYFKSTTSEKLFQPVETLKESPAVTKRNKKFQELLSLMK